MAFDELVVQVCSDDMKRQIREHPSSSA